MKKKKREGLTININLSNRWLYTFILLGILVIIAVGVYALTPGSKSNPGHLLEEISPPSGCSADQIIKWDGDNLVCVDIGDSICPEGTTAYYYDLGGDSTSSGTPGTPGTDTCDGDIENNYICPKTETKTCTDWYHYGAYGYYYSTRTCIASLSIQCE